MQKKQGVTILADKRKSVAISEHLHKEMLDTVHAATGVYPQIQEFVEEAIRAKLRRLQHGLAVIATTNPADLRDAARVQSLEIRRSRAPDG